MEKWIIIIISLFFVAFIPVNVYAMSSRPPVISEQIEGDGYLQKSYIDSRKTLIHDKNGKVVGYTKKSYLDSRKTVVYDTNDNVIRVSATRSDGLPQAQAHQSMTGVPVRLLKSIKFDIRHDNLITHHLGLKTLIKF